jgi:hypothetical protein
MKLIETGKLRSRLASLRERHWTKAQRVTVVAAIAIVMGCLFVTSYSLALGGTPPAATSSGSKLTQQPLARVTLNRAGVWAPKPRAHRLELLNGVEHRDLLLRRPRAVALSFRLRCHTAR